MTRLDMLKAELAAIKYFHCLSFDIRDAAVKYYEHEIRCIEEWGSENREVEEK